MSARTYTVGWLLGCLLLPCASAEKLKVEYDPDADFSRIRQYQWRTHPVFEKNPELQEVYATGIQLVMEAGNAELMRRGLQPADSAPDIFVTFFLHAQGASRNVTTLSPGPWWGPGYGWYGSAPWTTTRIESYLDGLLLIDIIDARTTKLLWRAYCGEQIRDMRKRDKNISNAVRKALERFPPGKK